MLTYRDLTDIEIVHLEALGNHAESWKQLKVAQDFDPIQLQRNSFIGAVFIGSRVKICDSKIKNYRIGDNSSIENVTALECRKASSFGNGVGVATMNECGGRTVKIYETLSAQIAYILAVYRHRTQTIAILEQMIEDFTRTHTAEIGEVGCHCQLTGARFIREVKIGDNVVIDGASALENGTICAGAHVGVDVKAYHFIIAEGAKVDNGVTIERCFVGESVILDKGFSAGESLFFANTHCENGEAASIFAGPYTVSHHKSSLLIAGMFSFFNAGSGANQSNHLFKSGAVHQSVHLRGCKFASGAYIMAPALEGAFTMVLGHHSLHHDTSAFPYSYLIEKDDRSMLMPAANLSSYGAVRDTEKWPARDKRKLRRDVINFEEYNPYICQYFITAIRTLRSLQEAEPNAEIYNYRKVFIKTPMLQRGMKLYTKAVVASVGAMLSKGATTETYDGSGRWIDLGGQYITKRAVDSLLDAVDRGEITSLEHMDNTFRTFAANYDHYAHDWAMRAYTQQLKHQPTEQDISEAIVIGENIHASMRRTTDRDRDRDCSLDMAISYGLDSASSDEVKADYYAVRGLK
ncbi:MAG: DUF4954 family protein [Alistipes sp.]